MADICLPDRLHCDPIGELGVYRRAAEAVVRFDAVTCEAATAQRREDLKPAVLDESIPVDDHSPGGPNPFEEVLQREPLSVHWGRCARRRARVAADIRRKLQDRLPLMLAAGWVANGRTPRQHQSRYTSFLRIAEEECQRRDLDTSFSVHTFANDKVLPHWLGDVAGGMSPGNRTEKLAEDEVARARRWHGNEAVEVLEKTHAAWIATGAAWTRRLEGVVLGHPGEVLALFHRYGLGLDWELRNTFDEMVPHARVDTREFNWVAARVPAVMRVFLAERDQGLVGLVLQDECVRQFDAATAALFLRNLLVDLGSPDLARCVRQGGPGAQDTGADGAAVPEVVSLDWRLQRFGHDLADARLTRERCHRALCSTLEGKALVPGLRS